MKNCIKFLFLTLVIGMFMFSGCSDDDDDYADEGKLKTFITFDDTLSLFNTMK